MFIKSNHSVKSCFASLVLVGSLFCILFGQGVHLHTVALHIGDHLDIHAHVHAHDSHSDHSGQPTSNDDNHQHVVSTNSEIIGTLVKSSRIKTEIYALAVVAVDTDQVWISRKLEQVPTLFDLPPPRLAFNRYHLSSYSFRGPPIA